jgi:hypothetical protein
MRHGPAHGGQPWRPLADSGFMVNGAANRVRFVSFSF